MGCVVPAAYMHGPRETFEVYENVSGAWPNLDVSSLGSDLSSPERLMRPQVQQVMLFSATGMLHTALAAASYTQLEHSHAMLPLQELKGWLYQSVHQLAVLQNFTRFSAWFGVNSHTSKQRRLLAELSCCMAASESGASCSRAGMRLDYLPALDKVSRWDEAYEQSG